MPKRIQKSNAKAILLIEGNPSVRVPIERILVSRGHHVIAVDTGEKGLQSLTDKRFDAVVCNHHLPGISGLDFYSGSRKRLSNAITILTASFAGDYLANDALALGIHVFMEMPFKIENLLTFIEGRYPEVWDGPPGGHLYITSGGQIMAISPVRLSGRPLSNQPVETSLQKTIHLTGRQWKLYLNPDAPSVLSGNDADTSHIRKQLKRAGWTVIDSC